MRPSWAEGKELEAEDFIVVTKRLPTGPLPRPYVLFCGSVFEVCYAVCAVLCMCVQCVQCYVVCV